MPIGIGIGLSPSGGGGGASATPLTFDSTATLTGVAGPGSYITTPDANDLDVTGDFWIAAKVALTDWTPAARNIIASKEQTTITRSYRFSVEATTGRLLVAMSADGSATVSRTSSVSPTVVDAAPLWVAVAVDVDNGAAGSDTRFYTAASSSVFPTAWDQLGTTQTFAGVLSIAATTSRVEIGSRVANAAEWLAGDVYGVLIGAGTTIGSGTVAVFTNDGVSAGAYVDPFGHTWTVN